MIGKEIRIERILNRNTGKTVIIPMDHGVTVGPIKGLENMKETVDNIVNGGANAIVLHKGLVRGGHRGSGRGLLAVGTHPVQLGGDIPLAHLGDGLHGLLAQTAELCFHFIQLGHSTLEQDYFAGGLFFYSTVN